MKKAQTKITQQHLDYMKYLIEINKTDEISVYIAYLGYDTLIELMESIKNPDLLDIAYILSQYYAAEMQEKTYGNW